MATNQKLGTAGLLYNCAMHMGLQPSWIIPGGVFVMTVDDEEKYVSFTRSSLNSHVNTSLAQNKHLTRLILERNNLPNIPFARPQTFTEATTFLRAYGTIIAKPVRGSGNRDIHIITRSSQLEDLLITNYILEQYISGTEMRYLVLNGKVIAVHRSDYGTSVKVGRMRRQISYPQSQWSSLLIASSLHIAQILGLKFAAVDYMIDATGHAYILEVNTSPDLKWFHAPTSGPIVDVARLFLEAMLHDMRTLIPSTALASSPVEAYS